jgi:hypothetical protein
MVSRRNKCAELQEGVDERLKTGFEMDERLQTPFVVLLDRLIFVFYCMHYGIQDLSNDSPHPH